MFLLVLLAVLVLCEKRWRCVGQAASASTPPAFTPPQRLPPPPLPPLLAAAAAASHRRWPPTPACAVFLKRLLGGPRGSVVLVVGPCDAGKTTLFHQLVEGSTHLGTVASMQANEASGPLASEKVRPSASWRGPWGTAAAADCISQPLRWCTAP